MAPLGDYKKGAWRRNWHSCQFGDTVNLLAYLTSLTKVKNTTITMATLGLLVKTELKKSSISAISLNRSNYHTLKKYQKCYKLLGIYKDDKELRTSQIATVGRQEATPEPRNEFSEITGALKLFINSNKKSRSEERENFKNPLQIKKRQFTKIRATQAAENVVKHRVSKISAEKNEQNENNMFLPFSKKKFGLERTVEEMIQESISKGEFKNLPGVGKPLPDNDIRNPYVDFVTHRLNEVLIDNGCTPKWITLQKEIREEIETLKEALAKTRAQFGPYPLNKEEAIKWEDAVLDFEQKTDQVNKKIRNFNLLVPIIEKQMFQVDLKRQAEKVLLNGKFKKPVVEPLKRQKSDIFDFLDVLFK
ncbi:dnaJ homolog subfamily C member 28-like [Tribolium madens]|uniref:dnaJ homolog subfamily C member 28-like n=1 Tax=Tribolium madens TaxID=41895 RepID=UPI001CF7582C|nr:dnaJ homolog subfamily C member 28-like [Tribolium madens]